MGNANGREEEGGGNINIGNVHDYLTTNTNPITVGRITSSDSMGANTPPEIPRRSVSPLLFTPQLPVAPLQKDDGAIFHNDMRTERFGAVDEPPEKGIPTVITWSLGGNNVAVEGSWDNWTSRKILRRSGKDHAVLLVLPSGIYHYKFIVDGEAQYSPDLPHVSTEMGHVCNVLNVHDYVPENLDSVAEFEAPASPESSYNREFPGEDDFAKEPMIVPPQLQLTVLGVESSDEAPFLRPQHVVLNHLFIEKGWAASQSMVALGLTHRFQSKYVTVLLYKPVRR
ncbi:SNF1-related protein kinase regulatory subunit beta-1-like isoform X1 [Chenopodium quinoa]|uniref:Association with the SNF1 complex (ASC) domain-containing protein n=1 Tax=Chenopodium quinoa TaxID=63459 RepID=A0A803MY83_CHEQI|nr:SNF1-related protein kinase regulatory subunit beta-1-like isoform X1 [Chenopodium quinoa]